MQHVALLVIAKEPLPGAAKTRLRPPCSPQQAATPATAALLDTLAAVALTPARRKVLVFGGDARRWCPDGFEVISQRDVDTIGDARAVALQAPDSRFAQALASIDRSTPVWVDR